MTKEGYLEELYSYINNEMIPKYEGLEECTMHFLPDELKPDVEFIFKVDEKLDFDDFGLLNFYVNRDLQYTALKLDEIYDGYDYVPFIYVLTRY